MQAWPCFSVMEASTHLELSNIIPIKSMFYWITTDELSLKSMPDMLTLPLGEIKKLCRHSQTFAQPNTHTSHIGIERIHLAVLAPANEKQARALF
jgi:hypothetical protein